MKLFGCFAAIKICDALSMLTVVSRGEWKISSALRSEAIASRLLRLSMSCRNCFLMRNLRPPRSTSDSPRSLDFSDGGGEELPYVAGVIGRCYGCDRNRLGDRAGGGQYGRAAQAVTDQDRGVPGATV